MTHDIANSEFAIHNHKEIVFLLDDLKKERTGITLEADDGTALITSVLKVSPENNAVYLDISPDNRINEKVIHSNNVRFVTQTGVKVRWHSSHLRKVALPDGDAFAMTIPSVVERIQRRSYFRLSTPQGGNALICKIPFENKEADITEVIESTIINMSAEGVGISIKGIMPELLSHGAHLKGCSIEFPDIGMVPVGLKLCGVWSSMKTRSGEQVHRLGCKFIDLSRGANNVVQRHMIFLEKDHLNKV